MTNAFHKITRKL